jgi:hypothetical protein
MNNYEDLINQIKVRQFKNMSFSLYNYISEESGYFHQLKNKGVDCTIDDMQSLLIELTKEEKEQIKKGQIERYLAFKEHIESNNNKVGVFILKQYGAIYVAKPKETIVML